MRAHNDLLKCSYYEMDETYSNHKLCIIGVMNIPDNHSILYFEKELLEMVASSLAHKAESHSMI